MHAQFVEWGEKSQLRHFLDVELQLVIKWKLQPYIYFSVRIRIVSVFGLEEYARIKAVESFNKPGARCWRPGIGVHWYGDFLVNHGGGFCCGFVILLLPVCILWLELCCITKTLWIFFSQLESDWFHLQATVVEVGSYGVLLDF